MIDAVQAKTLSRVLVRLFSEQPAVALTSDGLLASASAWGRVLVANPKSPLLEGVPGRSVNVKQVRGFLWRNRGRRAAQRRNAVVWLSYDEGSDTSVLGFGALVDRGVADRLGRLGYERVGA